MTKPPKKATPRKRSVKTPEKTPAMPPLAEQPHGGRIFQGGIPGNAGGGRTPSRVKALSRDIYEKHIPTLDSIASDTNQTVAERIRAIDVAGKHGGLNDKDDGTLTPEEYQRRIAALIEVVKRYVPQASHEALVHDLNSVHQLVLEETA